MKQRRTCISLIAHLDDLCIQHWLFLLIIQERVVNSNVLTCILHLSKDRAIFSPLWLLLVLAAACGNQAMTIYICICTCLYLYIIVSVFVYICIRIYICWLLFVGSRPRPFIVETQALICGGQVPHCSPASLQHCPKLQEH